MKHLKRSSLVASAASLAVLALPNLVKAQASPHLLPVSSTDVSLKILSAMFGQNIVNAAATLNTSGGVPGPGNNLFAVMFYQFNMAMLLVAGLIVTWGMVTGVLHTAHSGEWFGGRRMSPFWFPLRASLAAGGLMPVMGGFSAVQVAILFISIQGIGIANNVWSAAVGYLTGGGPITSNVQPTPPSPYALGSIARDMLLSLSCEYAYRDIIQADLIAAGQPDLPISEQSVTVAGPGGSTATATAIGGPGIGPDLCGGWMASPSPAAGGLSSALGLTSALTQNISKAVLDAQNASLSQMADALRPVAQEIATLVTNRGNGSLPAPGAFAHAVAAYQSTVVSAATAALAKAAPGSSSMTANGWAQAGFYYWQLSQLALAANGAVASLPATEAPNPGELGDSGSEESLVSAINYATQYANAEGAPAGTPVHFSPPPGWIHRGASALGSSLYSGASGLVGAAGTLWGTARSAVDSGYSIQSGLINWINQGLFPGSGDPLAALQAFGSNLMNWAYVIMGGAALGSLAAGLWGVGSATGAAGIVATLGTALGLPMLLGGLALVVWMPMLPAVLWISGVMSWGLLILEAMVAGPLWAVAHASPMGEGWAGERAKMGYQLVIALAIRPTLMVFGLLAGMALLRVMAWFIGQSLAPAIAGVTGTQLSGIVVQAGLIGVAVGLCVFIAHKSFSLIWMIPDRVLAWIGGGSAPLGESEAEHRAHEIVGGVISTGHRSPAGGIGGLAHRAGSALARNTPTNVENPDAPKPKALGGAGRGGPAGYAGGGGANDEQQIGQRDRDFWAPEKKPRGT